MLKKRGSIALILIQVFMLSAIFGTLSPKVSAALSAANTKTSYPGFPAPQSEEDMGFDSYDPTEDLKPEFVPGEVLVKFSQSISVRLEDTAVKTDIMSVDKLNKRYKVSEITRIFENVYKLTIPKDLDVLYVAREYELDPFIEYAEPNGIARTLLVPNDANYTQQWAHQIIESEDAWNVTTGDPNVVIAVVDSGVDYDHPDLAANIWINTDEIPDNGIDDDLNGFVDDVRGWDFVEAPPPVYPGEDGTEPDNDPMDFLGHGTAVAGVVAAVGNNGIGIAGVTWNSRIMAVRSGYAVYGGGILLFDQSAAGIRYAVDNGANIITMSFGGSYRSKVVYDAIKYAHNNGVLSVAAAGNTAQRVKTYPAAYEEVVAVTATDQYDGPAYFSNFGSWVEVAAPGVDILSTVSLNSSIGPYGFEYPYDYASGTSMAAPHVAGVAALILSRFPNMTRDQVRVQLRRTTVDLPPEGFDNYYGYGRISVSGAAQQVPADYDLLVLSWKLPFVSDVGETKTVAFFPSGYNLLGSTQYVSGSLTDLQTNNDVYMTFRSYTSATAPRSLYAHQETTTIGGGTYYLHKSESADALGTSLSVMMSNTGRKLWGNFVYQLTEVSSIPSSTWTIYYRTWFSASGGAAHADVDILIRRSDGTVRTTIATNVADSPGLTTTPQTLSGTYNFPGYTVVDQTDYLEIDYYCEVTTKKPGTPAYLRIDDNTLPPEDQTRANIYLPSEFTVEAEFTGSSNTEAWTQLVWTIDSSFTTESVTATFQLFNYTANAYSTSGDGYMTDTIGTTDVTKTQTITINPTHFRNATGSWKIKVKGVKSTSSQFDWQGDLIKHEVTWPLFSVKTTVLNFGTETITGINVKLLVNGEEKDSEDISELQSGQSATVSTGWTATIEGTHNVTTYAVPKTEAPADTENNAQSAYSWVKSGGAAKVPEDFSTIQEAVDTSNLGIYGGEATIRVSNGTYYEYDLLIQNMLTSLTLAGVDSRATIISGHPSFAGVWVNVDNVTIKGFTIKSSSVGVVVWSGDNIVSGNNLTNNRYGVHATRYYNNTIRDNIMSENSQYGIRIALSSGDSVINNTVSGSNYGLFLSAANKTLVNNNTFTDNNYGIWLTGSSDDVLTNNTLTSNTYGFGIEGYTLPQFVHNIDTSNTVDGKAIHYLINQSNLAIDPSTFPNVGYLGLVNSTGVTVRDLTLSKNAHGVMFAYTKDSTIQNVNASNNRYGISILNSTNAIIINNTVSDNYYGIYTSKSTNNTITYNILANDNYGIEVSDSTGNTLGNNSITNTYRGIGVYSDNDNTLEANTVANSTYGIYLYSSKGNVLTNTVANSTYGIYLYSSEDSVLTNNNMTGNSYNFFVFGFSLAEYVHDIDTSNTVNGKPMYYLINQAYLIIDPSTFPDIGYLALVNSINITVKNLPLLENNGQGILFANVTDSSIQEVNASNNYYGIHLLDSNTTSLSGNTLLSNDYGIRMKNSHNNTIDGNDITEIDMEGIYLESSSGNTIDGNDITEIDMEGIYLESSSGNTIFGNTILNSSRTGYYSGILLSNSGNNTIGGNTISYNRLGIKLDSAGNNTINDNSITYNNYGIYLWFCDVGNTVRGNTIANNSEGIHIVASNDNVIYHNNFIDNTRQVYNSASSSSWDNGAEGNYWSDYTGQDLDGDGIGDTAYIIDGSNQDNYPLMNLWGELIHALNLRVLDWDLADSIQGAYVYVDSDVKISDADGWANWTGISGTVYVKVKWHGGWVNGTFLVVVDSDKAIDIQSNIFDITVTTVESEQGAVLQYVNVTVYNATNNMIETGITDSDGKVYLTNVPNSTLTFIAREGTSPQHVIGNVTRTITTENQAETIICDQNYVSLGQDWGIIADNNTFSLSLIPVPPLPSPNALNYLKKCIEGLKERVKKIRSKPDKKREEVREKT